jgi:putative ABC transport system substrate-binding protein
MPVIGWLSSGSLESDLVAARLTAFRQGLNEMGYVEGQNVAIEYRWAQSRYDRLPALASDLVRRQVTVIAAAGIVPTFAAKAATSTIPIVFLAGVDPVQSGLVASLNRPGGNMTGVANLNVELTANGSSCCMNWCPRRPPSLSWSIRPTPPLLSPRRNLCRMRHALSGCRRISCRRAP